MTIKVRIRMAWWFRPAGWALIGYWLARRLLTARDPTDSEVGRASEWLARHALTVERV